LPEEKRVQVLAVNKLRYEIVVLVQLERRVDVRNIYSAFVQDREHALLMLSSPTPVPAIPAHFACFSPLFQQAQAGRGHAKINGLINTTLAPL
jgi:hypothetical protein